MKPCTEHPDRQTVTGFCFECWQNGQRAMRARRVQLLRAAIASGATVIEGWPNGRRTEWNLAGTVTVYTDGTRSELHQPFIASAMTPAYLADHLENRQYGFGWKLVIIESSNGAILNTPRRDEVNTHA